MQDGSMGGAGIQEPVGWSAPLAGAPGAAIHTSLKLGWLTLSNRIVASSACTYSAGCQGLAEDFHLVHLGGLALGDAGLVLQETTAIFPEGRITPRDLGIWNDDQIAGLSRVVRFLHSRGKGAGIRLGHAGRKAGSWVPGEGRGTIPVDRWGWPVVAPSALAFGPEHRLPSELDEAEISRITDGFAQAARRAARAGFDVVEIHAAEGYLLQQFLSATSNRRRDDFGGAFQNRVRIVLDAVRKVRAVLPKGKVLTVRVPESEGSGGGWDAHDSVRLSKSLRSEGVDLVSVASGEDRTEIEAADGRSGRSPFLERIRGEAGISVGAVGAAADLQRIERLIRSGRLDLVFLEGDKAQAPSRWLSAPSEGTRAKSGSTPGPNQAQIARFDSPRSPRGARSSVASGLQGIVSGGTDFAGAVDWKAGCFEKLARSAA